MKLALAGDTMLGRGVGEALSAPGAEPLAREVLEVVAEADLFVVNLECCISDRGAPWPDPAKPFFFRAPPRAADVLAAAGVDCATLANNHALDFGVPALLDTFEHLERAGLAWVGAGLDLDGARAPARLHSGHQELSVVAFSDHPRDYGAGPQRPGIAFADLRRGLPDWVGETVATEAHERMVLASPHWGPNMTSEPPADVRRAAAGLRAAGATLVAGHSAHVCHGVETGILYDLGDFVDDYAVDAALRNDLGLLFLVALEPGRPVRLEAVPLQLDYCRTRLAVGEEADWVSRRFRDACRALGTAVEDCGERLVAVLDPGGPAA